MNNTYMVVWVWVWIVQQFIFVWSLILSVSVTYCVCSSLMLLRYMMNKALHRKEIVFYFIFLVKELLFWRAITGSVAEIYRTFTASYFLLLSGLQRGGTRFCLLPVFVLFGCKCSDNLLKIICSGFVFILLEFGDVILYVFMYEWTVYESCVWRFACGRAAVWLGTMGG